MCGWLQGICKLIEFASGGGFTLEQCQQDTHLGYGNQGNQGLQVFVNGEDELNMIIYMKMHEKREWNLSNQYNPRRS